MAMDGPTALLGPADQGFQNKDNDDINIITK
jgi:hypothetical protein